MQTGAFVSALGAGFKQGMRAFPAPRPRAVRDHGDLDPVLGRIGALEVRLAITKKDIRRAQKLRYRVFYQEGSAIPNSGRLFARRDVDGYDAICDHLLVNEEGVARRIG